ncbi:MAG: hypothetical protein ACFFCX_14905 [Candidatus Sifarchaeia archaeon]
MDDTYASRFKVRKEHGVIIPNGINLDSYNPGKYNRSMLRRDFGMVDKTVIGTVATLRKRIRGHEFLLQAIPSILEDYPDCHFYLIGISLTDTPIPRRLPKSKPGCNEVCVGDIMNTVVQIYTCTFQPFLPLQYVNMIS